ncbi:MAG TPA: ABC transporter ATP-binding protein [Acidimicrobiia bacterium]|nr:ABC transporter ATP-binding protein [Acidimicrobiia bacterium]
MLLELTDVHVHYGKIAALKGISLTVDEGEIVTLIGGNGAGKTTTLKTISGLRPVAAGTIQLRGENIVGIAPHKLVGMGVAHAPEGRGIFPGMTVRENLEIGAYARHGSDLRSDLDRALNLFPRLKERIKQSAGTLSGGEQQMLAIGRALMARPKLLLLDEPSMGLAPKLVSQVFETITEINQQGTTILVVEQNAAQALQRAHRAYVIETGRVVIEGPASELQASDEVRKAYLGED